MLKQFFLSQTVILICLLHYIFAKEMKLDQSNQYDQLIDLQSGQEINYVTASKENTNKIEEDIKDDIECPRHNQQKLVKVTALEHVENSNILIVGTQSGDIELWDFQTKDILTRFGNNKNSPSIKKIIYLSNYDKILVIYNQDLEIQDIKQEQYSLIIWDPQTQKQTFQFPKQENFKKRDGKIRLQGKRIIDISVQTIKLESESDNSIVIQYAILSDVSIITCTLNPTMEATCTEDVFNKNLISNPPLNIFTISQYKIVVFTKMGLIEFNIQKKTYTALFIINEGQFSQCLYYPTRNKYVLMNQKENSIFILNQDSQKEQNEKLIKLRSIKVFFDFQQKKFKKSNELKQIIRIENQQPALLVLLKGGQLLHINYEDDKILEEFSVPNPELIITLKSSPSFFCVEENGSISFYRQTTHIGRTDLQQNNPFVQINELRRQIFSATNFLPTEYKLSYTNNNEQSFVAELIQNIFQIYHLNFQSANLINCQTVSFIQNQQISDFFINKNAKIVYFYESTNDILFVCKIQNLNDCIKIKLEMNNLNKDESYELKIQFSYQRRIKFQANIFLLKPNTFFLIINKRKRVIHYSENGRILIVNNMNNLYVFSINEGEHINLQDHLIQVFSQKYITRSQSPMMINLLKQRYAYTYDSYLLFLSDGNKIIVFEYIHSKKSLNTIYSKTYTKQSDKVVAIEILHHEQYIMLQFIDNTFQFYDLINNQILKDKIELEQYNNQFINYDFFLQLDLHRINGTNHILSQLNNKRIVIFDFKTKEIHFMSNALNNYVDHFKIDYLQQKFFVTQYSTTENIDYYELILQRPYLTFRQERGTISKARLFNYLGEYLVLQHEDNTFWIVDLKKQQYQTVLFYNHTTILNDKLSFFVREGLFTLITSSGKIFKYPFINSEIQGPPQVLDSPCPDCGFDEKIKIKNTNNYNVFIIQDSFQYILYNSEQNQIIWYQKFQNEIVNSQMFTKPCEIYIGFVNRQIEIWNCENYENIYLEREIKTGEDIINFHRSIETHLKLYVVSKINIIVYSFEQANINLNSGIDQVQEQQLQETIFEANGYQIIRSEYLSNLRTQVLITSENNLILLSFGQKQILKLSSLTSQPNQVVFIGNTEDKKTIIISTSQKVFFINIWPLFQYFDYNSKALDFYKVVEQPNKQIQPQNNGYAFKNQDSYTNACILNIYFTASSESLSMSKFGLGTKESPFTHFSAVQSLLIQFGLSNLIFNYRENQLNLRFYCHEATLFHKIQKRVNLQNSPFTSIKFIGQQNSMYFIYQIYFLFNHIQGNSLLNESYVILLKEFTILQKYIYLFTNKLHHQLIFYINKINRNGQTIIQIEGGYLLNNYKSVTFENLIFKSIDTIEQTDKITSSFKGIKQFTVQNIEFLLFYRSSVGLYSSSPSDVLKYIQVSNCTRLNITQSEFQATSFMVDNLSWLYSKESLIKGLKQDIVANENQKINFLKKNGMIFIRQVIKDKSIDNNRMIINQINLINCQTNSVKFYAFDCSDKYKLIVKAPSILLNQTYLQHSSIFGLDNCLQMQQPIIRIDSVTLLDLGYRDTQILTDGYIQISRIEKVTLKNTNMRQKNQGSQAILLMQYSEQDMIVGTLKLSNLYLSNTILFQITKNFQIENVMISDCKIEYSIIFQIQSQIQLIKTVFMNLSVYNTELQYQSKIVDILNSSSVKTEIGKLNLESVNATDSQILQAYQDKSQIYMNITDIFLSNCLFSGSRLIEKGNQVYINIKALVISNNTQFHNSIALKSVLNIENQCLNLLNIPLFNIVDQLNITNSIFNQSKVLEITEQAQFFIHRLDFQNNIFTAQIQDQLSELYLSILENFNESNHINDDNINSQYNQKEFTSFPQQNQNQNNIRYLLEVTNLKVFNLQIVQNMFSGYIISGQPQNQSTQSQITQIYENLNLSHNIFVPQSNFIFFELNFNSLNRNSEVSIYNFTLVNNTLDYLNPNIPLSQLEDGRAFYFFGSDKLGKISLVNGVIEENENIGFLNAKFSLDEINITNVNATGKEDSPIQLQPFIQILHPRRFVVSECSFQNITTVGYNIINVDLNRQYFLVDQNNQEFKENQSDQNKNVLLSQASNTTKNIYFQNSGIDDNIQNQTSQFQENIKNNINEINEDRLFSSINNFKARNQLLGKIYNTTYSNSSATNFLTQKNIQENKILQEKLQENNNSENENKDNFQEYQSQFYDEDDDDDDDIPFNYVDEEDSQSQSSQPKDNIIQQQEKYYVIIYQTTFKDILGLNISSSVTSSVINIQSGLEINVFIENCIFEDNLVQTNENYSRQRRLSQVEIMAINANIFMNKNKFLYGRFELPQSYIVDTVYFHLLGKNVIFSNFIKSYSYFNGECNDYETANFMSGGIIEAQKITIEKSQFIGTCTLTQPTLYIKLFEKSELKILNSNFTDLYAFYEGAGVVVNGVQNKVNITLENIVIDRMYSPSSSSEGFLLFNNLKEGSVINITHVVAKQLYTQNGSFIKSTNNRIYILLDSISINNLFNQNNFAKQKQVNDEDDNSQDESSEQEFETENTNNKQQTTIQNRLESNQDELKMRDSGTAIFIQNAKLVKITKLQIENYGIVFNKISDVIQIEKVELVVMNRISLLNNTLYTTSALRVSDSKLILRNSLFSNNSYGGTSLFFVNMLQSNRNDLENINIFNNVCINQYQCYSPVYIQFSLLSLKNISISYNSGNNTVGGIYLLLEQVKQTSYDYQHMNQTSKQYKITFNNVIIEQNIGLIGGAVFEFSQNMTLLVKDTHIRYNKGTQIGGISLQLYDPNSIFFVNSTITDNTSNQIGGVKIQKSSTLQLRDSYQDFIYNNSPNQITSGPRSFSIIPVKKSISGNEMNNNYNQMPDIDLINQTSTSRQYEYIQKEEKLYMIKDFDSGDKLPPFYLKLFDENNNTDFSNKIPTVKVCLNVDSQTQKGQFLKGDEGKTGSFIQQNKTQYNSEVGLLFQHLQVYGMPGSTVSIVFRLAEIIYDNPKSLVTFDSSTQEYSFRIDVLMRKCTAGEQIKNNIMTTECEACSKQYYSVLDPHLHSNVKCLKCPDNASCPGGNALVLNTGFWRSSIESDLVIQCQFQSLNCLGGQNVGDESCIQNRIGPLCETCDIKNGYTDLSANQCLNCNEKWQGILIISSILVFFLFYMFISIDSTVSRIKKFRILFEYSSANHIGQTSMLVKQFVSYLQVLSIISYFRFNFGKESISSIIYNIGNPLIAFDNVVSCFVYQLSNQLNIPHIYASFTISLLIPISLSLIVVFLQMILNFRNYYYRKYYLSTMMLVNYFYFTPLILARTMELLICRTIGDKEYISASVIYSCRTDISNKINLFYLLPLLVFLIFIIPVWIIYRIRARYIQKLPLKYFQYILGDFRKKFFYWEFVRFFTKIALVSFPIVLQDDIRTMGQVLNLILIVYYASVLYFHPYWTQICQRMELITGAALFMTFHFCLLSHNKESYSGWWWAAIIIIALVNIPLIAWYIISFFQAYKPTLNRFFNSNSTSQMSESNDPKERARLLWQLAYYTVSKHIKKEKIQQQINIKNAQSKIKINQSVGSSFATRYTLSNSGDRNENKISRLLWWKNGRSAEQNNRDSQLESSMNQPLISNNNQQINTHNNLHQQSQSSDDYNPYHDFNFSFLPQETTQTNKRFNNQ